MRVQIPSNFDGAKFGAKYFVDFNPDLPDIRFWVDANGYLVCPSLESADLSDCIIDPPPSEQVFALPIRTPAIYAEDIFVSSRKIKDDPDEAFSEAIEESEKPRGEAKSLDLITRSQTKMIKELLRRITALEKIVKKL